MKKTAFILLLTCIVISCSKDNGNTTTTKAPEEILTESIWRLDEIRFLQNNTPYYYKRGQTGDVLGFDSESIKFNVDKTGTYKSGNTYNLSWDFADATKTKIRYVINYPTPLTVNWENIKYSETLIEYTEYYNKAALIHWLLQEGFINKFLVKA